MGIWRKLLIKSATGSVLEIGSGTGRNFSFYDGGRVTAITAVDFSRPMLRVSQAKGQNLGSSIEVRHVLANAMSLPFENESFDTLVDTHGLCSYERPLESLKEALRCLKPGGKVLLLEHGISTWSALAFLQESFVERHAFVWGCFNTRDIEALLKAAGVRIIRMRRRHFGTSLYLEAEKPLMSEPLMSEPLIRDEPLTLDKSTLGSDDASKTISRTSRLKGIIQALASRIDSSFNG